MLSTLWLYRLEIVIPSLWRENLASRFRKQLELLQLNLGSALMTTLRI